MPVEPGYNLVGTLHSLTSTALTNLNLYTGDPATGLAAGLNPASADNILIVEPDGAVTTIFYYQDATGQERWYTAAYQAAGDRLISPGTPFVICRKPPRGSFDWCIPAE